jgi:hypothetical protein
MPEQPQKAIDYIAAMKQQKQNSRAPIHWFALAFLAIVKIDKTLQDIYNPIDPFHMQLTASGTRRRQICTRIGHCQHNNNTNTNRRRARVARE